MWPSVSTTSINSTTIVTRPLPFGSLDATLLFYASFSIRRRAGSPLCLLLSHFASSFEGGIFLLSRAMPPRTPGLTLYLHGPAGPPRPRPHPHQPHADARRRLGLRLLLARSGHVLPFSISKFPPIFSSPSCPSLYLLYNVQIPSLGAEFFIFGAGLLAQTGSSVPRRIAGFTSTPLFDSDGACVSGVGRITLLFKRHACGCVRGGGAFVISSPFFFFYSLFCSTFGFSPTTEVKLTMIIICQYQITTRALNEIPRGEIRKAKACGCSRDGRPWSLKGATRFGPGRVF